MRRLLITLGITALLGAGAAPAWAGIIVTVGKIDCEDGRTQTKRVGDLTPPPASPPSGSMTPATPPTAPPPAPPPAAPGGCAGEGPKSGARSSGSCAVPADGVSLTGRGGSAGASAGGTAEAGPIDQGDEIVVMGCGAGGAEAPLAFGLGILVLFGLRRRFATR